MATISILANTVSSDHLAIADCDDTAFGAETLTWQDPVHSWKAGPGEVMTVDFFSCTELVILLSYCGLVDAKIRDSDKDLPVQKIAMMISSRS